MGNFITAYRITKEIEGGYHNGGGINSNDLGGETFKGIARKANPTWIGWKKIDNLKSLPGFPNTALNSPEINRDVLSLYKNQYWDTLRLDDILYQPICNEMFDTAVNMGVNTSARFLQRGINYLNRNRRNFRNIEVDGKIGNITLGIVNNLNLDDRVHLFNILNIQQGSRYLSIIDRNESQEDFLRGWLQRVEIMRKG